jgi:hypothetical protein
MGITIISTSQSQTPRVAAQSTKSVRWNVATRLILSDVDETVADVYTPATPGMLQRLSTVLRAQRALVLISGGGLESIKTRVVDGLDSDVRQNVLIIPCSGAEAWGFNPAGNIRTSPVYSLLNEKLTVEQQAAWRAVMREAIDKFGITTFGTRPKPVFRELTSDPLHVMYDDRGPQITFEVINGIQMAGRVARTMNQRFVVAGLPEMQRKPDGTYDLRSALARYCADRLHAENVAITPREAGTFALDFALEGVDKAEGVIRVLASDELEAIIAAASLTANQVEVWGDKFNVHQGGTDSNILRALTGGERIINFRPDEDPSGFPSSHTITFWNGPGNLHVGCENYLAQAA